MPAGVVRLVICLLFGASLASRAQDEPTPEHIEFFESRIRPVLVDRCYECHSARATAIKGGLRLDSRNAILKGGDSGIAVVAGKPDESLLIQALRYEAAEMPPDGKLHNDTLEAFSKWVELGVPWPKEAATAAVETTGYDWEKAKRHWAWQPVRQVTPPTIDRSLAYNGIDRFVISRLRERKLKQSPPAEHRILVRRMFFDLIGLPPTPEEMTQWAGRFASRDANDVTAVRDLIDELLSRPQYGERWGRHWLDVARYSDVGGWTQDNRNRPEAWRYRDWVVEAFNQDMPYDEFVRQQIVGDRMGRKSAVGTGFFALGPHYSSDGGDPESVAQAQSETLDDRVDTFSRAFLGLTVSCARCHDHKFDPIPTQDYYSLAGIFRNTQERETPLVPGEVVAAYHKHHGRINEVNKNVNDLKNQKNRAAKEKKPFAKQAELDKLSKSLEKLRKTAPPKYAFAHTVHDTGSEDMKVAVRGNLLKPGELAPRRFLRIVAGEKREHFAKDSGREQLAAAVTDRANPLTARVFVNRVWLHHFGRALVRTPDNFGTLGEKPTHPELLDWLAATFIESGWSIKQLHRTIMLSTTYRSSSAFDKRSFEADGDNRSLWRVNPRRMDVETWRDSLLAVTGELDSTIGGRAIDNIVSSKRRTMYARISRNSPYASDGFLRMFDFPIPRATSAKRTTNVIPQQFLFMMNSQFMIDRGKALAGRLEREIPEEKSVAQRISRAYLLLYSRRPTQDEVLAGTEFVTGDLPKQAALTSLQQYCQVLLSSNEFMYVR